MIYKRVENNAVKERFAYKINGGYEFLSNSRNIKYIVCKSAFYNYCGARQQETCYYVSCFVEEGGFFVSTLENQLMLMVDDFINQLKLAPNFTRAVDDYCGMQ